ncbi:hypothetical protein FXV77_10625 [Sphingobacterium phlebotomi]|uniref:Uncharacterized protein n=1 Tax=Sphingobacterium phlebotomi TaxID=2605433 RepID=A0A5D4H7W4_9SPHI|nr:hypothetical protein [Sphingobacterium phlebotomi]TYR36353.1 hypothetical protein FXV77_10625 [Sphingobacterium phlebotomi]
MLFKDWTYRRKNRALLALVLLLLLLSWYLAFGKTYRLIAGYRELSKGMAGDQLDAVHVPVLKGRVSVQDSLLDRYSADSTQWISRLLVEVGEVLDSYPVGVSFENKAVGSTTDIVERELVLQGSFSVLQQALEALEERFFIKSIQAYVEKEQLRYKVKLATVKAVRE